MPLDNNATISDVISTLNDLQGINQKAELASVIGSPASADDNITTQITKLQTGKNQLVNSIIGKGGTVSSSDSFNELANAISFIGDGIKSAQTVIYEWNTTTAFSTFTTQNITIDEVDYSNAIVLVNTYAVSGFTSSSQTITREQHVRARLTSNNNVEIGRGGGSVGNILGVKLIIVEFEKLKSLQTGLFNAATTTISIDTVDLNKSFVLYNRAFTSSSASYEINAEPLLTITSESQMYIKNNQSTLCRIAWQIVEFE